MDVKPSELKRLDWNEIYRVSQRKRVATPPEIDAIEHNCRRLPQDYALFVQDFGFGSLNDIDILTAEAIKDKTPFLRKEVLTEWLSSCRDVNQPAIIPSNSHNDAVPLAKTVWGDFYFVSPTQPGTLWYIWRSHDWADCNPTTIPLGFGNLFLHKYEGGQVEQLGGDDPVFRPSIQFDLSQVLLTPIQRDVGWEEFVIRCKAFLQPTKMNRSEYGARMFVAKWGAEFRFGSRRGHDAFVVTCIYDPVNSNEISKVISEIKRFFLSPLTIDERNCWIGQYLQVLGGLGTEPTGVASRHPPC